MDASVLIGTFNRCSLLAATLDSLAAMRVHPGLRWEVIVVDNNSTDGTRSAVESRTPAFPAPLRYIFEPRQGKSHAVNTGLATSRGAVVAFTDDDVHVDAGWLEAAVSPLMARPDIHYTGGPVFPIWEAAPPPWLIDGFRRSARSPRPAGLRARLVRVRGAAPDSRRGQHGGAAVGHRSRRRVSRRAGSSRRVALRAGAGRVLFPDAGGRFAGALCAGHAGRPSRASIPHDCVLSPPLVVLEGRRARADGGLASSVRARARSRERCRDSSGCRASCGGPHSKMSRDGSRLSSRAGSSAASNEK